VLTISPAVVRPPAIKHHLLSNQNDKSKNLKEKIEIGKKKNDMLHHQQQQQPPQQQQSYQQGVVYSQNQPSVSFEIMTGLLHPNQTKLTGDLCELFLLLFSK
jgi:hypothetical protein